MEKPKPPAWLRANKAASKEFKRLADELHELGLAGPIDVNALARYAVTWVRWQKVLQQIEADGETFAYKDAADNVKAVQVSAATSLAKSLSEELIKLEDRFGLNPAARSRMTIAPPQPQRDPTDEYFDTAPMKMTS